ncbi:hypothetical protein ACFUN7_03715 [Streptomyces sp. NPDC057236]|uniref:hypothetical protein n=1 Tax=Streptomyces sp. NPDC057236 TaxID=3346059 RepID=UPI00363CC4CF
MGRVLKRVARVPWAKLSDSQGSAQGIPALLSTLAWGDQESASAALDELSDRVCALGFVVSEATAHVVPFLVELADDSAGRHRADILALLAGIHAARQWESTAAAATGKDAEKYQEKVAWEAAGRSAVAAGLEVFRRLLDDPDPDVARAARDLVSVLE